VDTFSEQPFRALGRRLARDDHRGAYPAEEKPWTIYRNRGEDLKSRIPECTA